MLLGNASKVRSVLDWDYKTSFEELVYEIVHADLNRSDNRLLTRPQQIRYFLKV